MGEIVVEVRIEVRLENLVQHGKLALFLRFEGIRIIQDLAVPVAQNVGGEPPFQAQHA